ncbi:MAG: O-antigen ligase domain-containing protein [Phycisphaerae bacterium]|nr:O-antigen ligase domain-containing protein [Phycisphaerae bacterium]
MNTIYSPFAGFVLFAWLPIVIGIFAANQSARRAIIIAFVSAWLFLPMATMHFAGLPSYDKMSATCGGVLLAALIFDSKRMFNLGFMPSIVDIPMIIWCLCPIGTAMANDPELTTHDGISWALQQTITWGLPYLIGRIYFSDRQGLRDLAKAIFIGGLIYMPLCLFEIRFSPSLHFNIYGYYQHSLGQQLRSNGFYRPLMFLEHGLAVGLYMANATLAGIWLWWTGALKKLWGYSTGWMLWAMGITTILCQSWGAMFLFMGGLACLFCYKYLRSGILLIVLLAIPPAYVSSRIIFQWHGGGFEQVLLKLTDPARTQSMMYRVQNEEEILKRAMQHPWFGWGNYARAFQVRGYSIFDLIYTPDSLWINAFGPYGWVGLGSLLALGIPLLFLRVPKKQWAAPDNAGVVIFAVFFALYQLDNMSNDMANPLFVLGLGGVCGLIANGALKQQATNAGRVIDDPALFALEGDRDGLYAAMA